MVVFTFLNFGRLAAQYPAQSACINRQQVLAVRCDEGPSLSLALQVLQPDGHDATGLALELCQLVDAYGQGLVYLQADGTVGVGVDFGTETAVQFLARTRSQAELEVLAGKAADRYAYSSTEANSRRCFEVWDAIVLRAR